MRLAFSLFCLVGCVLAFLQIAYRWHFDLPADWVVWSTAAVGVVLAVVSASVDVIEQIRTLPANPRSDRMAVGE